MSKADSQLKHQEKKKYQRLQNEVQKRVSIKSHLNRKLTRSLIPRTFLEGPSMCLHEEPNLLQQEEASRNRCTTMSPREASQEWAAIHYLMEKAKICAQSDVYTQIDNQNPQFMMLTKVAQICKSKALISLSNLLESPVVKFLPMLHKTSFHQAVMNNLSVRHPFLSNLTMSKQKGAKKYHHLSIWLI